MLRVALLLMLPLITLGASGLEIIAHRGASRDAPENTMAAFRLGWEQGADADELDIFLTRDGRIAVLHDATTKRTTDVDLPVAESTLAQLQALDAGSKKGARWAGEKVPALEEVLATLPAGKRLFIEIKCGPEVLPALETALRASGHPAASLVLISFDYATLRQARERFPHAPIYWLASTRADKKTGVPPELDALLARAVAARFDGLNLDHKFPFDAAFAAKVHAAGLKLYAWTVNDAAIARRLAAAGLDGLTTDRPAWLREHLR